MSIRSRVAAATACAVTLVPAAALAAAASPPAQASAPAPSTAPASTASTAPSPARAPATARAASSPRCATSGLDIWLLTNGNGTAGSIYYDLELTNLSGHACTVDGYPGVSAVDLAGHQLGGAASRDPAVTPRVVRLANGASAISVVRIVDTGALPPSSCDGVTAAGLRVYPPNQTTSKVAPFPFPACARTGASVLSVRALQRPS